MNKLPSKLPLLRSFRLVAVAGLLAITVACGTVGASAGSAGGSGPLGTLGTAAFQSADSIPIAQDRAVVRREIPSTGREALLRLPNPCPPPHR